MNPLQESQRLGSLKSSTRPVRYPEELSEFAHWRYETPELDSRRFGLTVCDIDQVFFHDEESTKEAYIMLLEVKSHGKTGMEVHQENIYNLCDSVFRLARGKTLSVRLWGRVEQRKLRYMGWHLLVLSNTRPDNSEWMLWDKKHYINEGRLVRILRFELDPYTLHSGELFKEATATTAPLEAGSELEQLRMNRKQVIEQAPDDTKRTPAAAILGVKQKPTRPCHTCGSTDWWWRPASGLGGPGGWLCGKCHPNPNPVSKEAEVTTEKGHCKHGEFILRDGCPQCMAEKRQQDEPANTHRPYSLADGATIPSVTTILSILDKPGLPHWAWECGRQDLDYREIRDAAGRVGTLAHHLIACHLKGLTPLPGGYSPEEVKKANKCFARYLAWENQNTISPVMIEEPLVSEEFKYGGTPDLLAELNGEFVLVDFKTGGAIYDSYFYQVAAYRQLLTEQGWPVASARILRISPDDNYEVAMQLDSDRDWQIFWHCLGVWQLQSEVG